MSQSIRSLALCAPLLLASAPAATPPRMGQQDRARIAEAFATIAAVQEKAWPGWSKAPSSLVLVDRDFEYLLRSGDQPEGVRRVGERPAAGRPRPRAPPDVLADIPRDVPGVWSDTHDRGRDGAEGTGKRSTAWVLAVAHEHFHQLQYSHPGYWSESQALGLAGDDQTGMWMLDYLLPVRVDERGLRVAVEAARPPRGRAGPGATGRARGLLAAVTGVCRGLKPEDYRYLSLQLWQEGIARYAETRLAEIAAREHRVSAEFAALHDYRTFAAAADSLRGETLDELRTQTMKEDGRTVFYAFGAALGLLLDQEGTPWRGRYLAEKFYLEKYRAPRGDPDAVPVPTN